jgi:sulfur-oxidizing protein SoxZ
MSEPIRIRAVARDGMVNVKVVMAHPMETGQRKDPSGKFLPPHYIRNMTATVGGRPVLHAELGPAVSRNPYLEFNFKGAQKGDRLTVSWIDNKGDKRTDEATIA